MADLGSIATVVEPPVLTWAWRENQLRQIVVIGEVMPMAFGAARDDSVGASAAPSLRMTRYGVYRCLWSIAPGSRRVSVKVRQTLPDTPRPRLVVKATPEVGLAADLTADAPAGTDWVTIGPLAFTATAIGAVWVELWCLATGTGVACWWDDLATK